MRVDRRLLGWGVFFVLLGGVPLAVQSGVLDAGLTDQVVRLWPLIVIGIGLGIVLRLTSLAWLGGLVVAVTFGLLLGSLLAGGVEAYGGACIGTSAGEVTT